MNTLAHTWPAHSAAPSQAAPQDGVQYTLTLPIGAQRTLARGWLWLARFDVLPWRWLEERPARCAVVFQCVVVG